MISICTECKGKGLKEYEHLTNYHRGEYDSTYAICQSCTGTGLVDIVENQQTKTNEDGSRVKTTTITTSPYKPLLHLAEKYPYVRGRY